MTDNIRISVIIPVYNTAAFLDDCLSSVVRQTYSNLQIILIDDGSTDASGSMCDLWAEKDERIQVIHQKNAGVSAARNAGLCAASGDLIAFLDSDDTLPPEAYEQLVTGMGNADLVMGRTQAMAEDGTLLAYEDLPSIAPQRDTFLLELFEERSGCYLGYLVDKLIRRESLEQHQIRFDPAIRMNEDRLFLTEYLIHSDGISLIDAVVYHYRQRSSSVMQQSRGSATVRDSEMTVLDSFDRLIPMAQAYSPVLYAAVIRKAFVSALDLCRRVDRRERGKLRRIRRLMRGTAVRYIRAETVRLPDKLKLAVHYILKR